MTNKINFEDILPGDVIQIRINPRPGYKGLTHDPMTVKAIANRHAPDLATITFSDAKNVLGHSVERSEYTLISRPKPKKGIHAFDKEKTYVIRRKVNRDQYYLIQHEAFNGWTLRQVGESCATRIHPDHYENSLYVGGIGDYHAPEEYVPTIQEQLDDLGIIPNEIYYRKDGALFYRFIGDGKAQYTRFKDGWRNLEVGQPHINLIKKGGFEIYA